jgi:hypothetical protein
MCTVCTCTVHTVVSLPRVAVPWYRDGRDRERERGGKWERVGALRCRDGNSCSNIIKLLTSSVAFFEEERYGKLRIMRESCNCPIPRWMEIQLHSLDHESKTVREKKRKEDGGKRDDRH